MIFLAIIVSLAAIALLSWLLFTLTVFAPSAFVGVTAGARGHGTGARMTRAILTGVVAAAVTLAAGHLLMNFVRPVWLRLIVAAAFIAPAAIAGFHASNGVVNHLIPSDGSQIAFSVTVAIAVGITIFIRRRNGSGPASVRAGPNAWESRISSRQCGQSQHQKARTSGLGREERLL